MFDMGMASILILMLVMMLDKDDLPAFTIFWAVETLEKCVRVRVVKRE